MAVIDQDHKVCEFLPGIGTRQATEAGIKRIMNHHKEHGFLLYAVELKVMIMPPSLWPTKITFLIESRIFTDKFAGTEGMFLLL